jgi:Na+/proline symporter
VCTKDIYQGLIRRGKQIADNKLLWMGRFTTIGIAFCCTLVGSQVDKMGGAFTFVFTLLGLTSAPTYLPPLIGLYYKKTPAWGANLAFILGFVSGVVMKFGLSMPLFHTVIINTLVTVGVFLIAGLLDPVKGKRKKTVEDLFEIISKPAPPKPEMTAEQAAAAPAVRKGPDINRVIAVGCVLFAVFLIVSGFVTKSGGGMMPNMVSALGLLGISGILFTISAKK